MQKQRITAAIATALCLLPAALPVTAATAEGTVTQSEQAQPNDTGAARLKAARLKSAATTNDANTASTGTTTAPAATQTTVNGEKSQASAPATTAAPKTRQYAKEYAIQYCRENEMTGEKDPVLDRVISDSWYGQERGEFHEWHKCVTARSSLCQKILQQKPYQFGRNQVVRPECRSRAAHPPSFQQQPLLERTRLPGCQDGRILLRRHQNG